MRNRKKHTKKTSEEKLEFYIDKKSGYSFYEQVKMQVCSYLLLGELSEES